MPGRAELVDLMLDAAYAHMPRTDTTGQPWRVGKYDHELTALEGLGFSDD